MQAYFDYFRGTAKHGLELYVQMYAENSNMMNVLWSISNRRDDSLIRYDDEEFSELLVHWKAVRLWTRMGSKNSAKRNRIVPDTEATNGEETGDISDTEGGAITGGETSETSDAEGDAGTAIRDDVSEMSETESMMDLSGDGDYLELLGVSRTVEDAVQHLFTTFEVHSGGPLPDEEQNEIRAVLERHSAKLW